MFENGRVDFPNSAVHWQFWILDSGLGPEPPQIRSGLLGLGRTWIFIGRVDDLVPGLAGRGGGPLRPPVG
jgi:hypothetical protein